MLEIIQFPASTSLLSSLFPYLSSYGEHWPSETISQDKPFPPWVVFVWDPSFPACFPLAVLSFFPSLYPSSSYDHSPKVLVSLTPDFPGKYKESAHIWWCMFWVHSVLLLPWRKCWRLDTSRLLKGGPPDHTYIPSPETCLHSMSTHQQESSLRLQTPYRINGSFSVKKSIEISQTCSIVIWMSPYKF